MKTETKEHIKKGIELHKALANTLTAEQKELIEKLFEGELQTCKMHIENYEESVILFELHMACCYFSASGFLYSLLDNLNDSNNKEYNKVLVTLSNYISGHRG